MYNSDCANCAIDCEKRIDDIEITQEDIDSTAKINATAIEKELAAKGGEK